MESTHADLPLNRLGLQKEIKGILNEKNMHDYFQAKVAAIVVHIMKRIPIAVIHGMMPDEKYTCKKLDISHLKVFGCIVKLDLKT